MPCLNASGLDDNAFFAAFNLRTACEKVPVNGGIDLTTRCNLKCVHCYLAAGDSAEREVLSKSEALRIIDEVADAGCLFLLITGGEPLLHPEFPVIYRHARKRGLLVTVFTNGTLIDKETVALFSEYTPLEVEISIYGACSSTHDSITGVSGSYDSALRGLKLLREAGIKVRLKTMLMTVNEREFDDMCLLAESSGVPFRMDAGLFPTLAGNKGPESLRVSAERAAECEFAMKGRKEAWQKYVQKIGEVESDGSLYVCGAAVTSFHVTAEAQLQPCLMTPHIHEDLRKHSFHEAWGLVADEVTDRRASADNPCVNCPNGVLCDGCPGFFRLETGMENEKSDFLCRLAEKRAGMLGASDGV